MLVSPATHLLTPKDIVYRNKAADIKMIVAVADDKVQDSVDAAQADSPSLALKVIVGGQRQGWSSFDDGVAKAEAEFSRPTGAAATSNDDALLFYFTSGTTGYPKMVRHNQTYPLGHILTAKYWQNVRDGGLHLTDRQTKYTHTHTHTHTHTRARGQIARQPLASGRR